MSVIQAEYTDNIDSGNTFRVEIPINDPRLPEVVAGRKWEHYREGEGLVFVGEIESVQRDETRGVVIITGPTAMGALLYRTTFRRRQYINQQFGSIMDNLLKNTGWVASGSDATLMVEEFRGIPLLRAIITMMRTVGNHFRETVTKPGTTVIKEIEYGPFGADSGVVISGGTPDSLLIDDENLAWVEKIMVENLSADVWNWLEPLGGGVGTAQITLEHSNRASPYKILKAILPQDSANPVLAYFIADITVFDSFQRPNGSLGTADTGQSWSADLGTWVVTASGGDLFIRAQCNALVGGEGIATIDSGEQDCWISAEVGQGWGGVEVCGLAFRYEDNSNYWKVSIARGSTTLKLIKVVADVETTDSVTITGGSALTGDRFEVTMDGDSIAVKFRGIPYIQIEDSFQNDKTKHGFYTEATGIGMDNFYCAGKTTSIFTYGLRERTVEAKEVTLLSTEGPASTIRRAANTVYDLASVYLDRNKVTRDRYTVNVSGLPPTVRAGDKVRLRYKGLAERDDETMMYLDVDQDIFILARRRRFNEDGTVDDQVTISNVLESISAADASALTAVDDAAQAFKVSPALTVNNNSVRIYEPLDDCDFVGGGNPIDFTLRIENNVAQILRCNLRLFARRIRSTAVGAESGGAVTSSGGSSHSHTTPNHSHPLDGVTSIEAGTPSGGVGTSGAEGSHIHVWAVYIDNVPGAFTERRFRDVIAVNEFNLESQKDVSMSTGASTLTHDHTVPDHIHPAHNHGFAGETTDSGGADTSGTDTAHTHTGGAHTHAQIYGIFEGGTASNIRIKIDGTDRTGALGGPWTGGPWTIDMTEFLMDGSGIVVQGDHQIRFAQGNATGGAIEAWFDMITLVAPIPIS